MMFGASVSFGCLTMPTRYIFPLLKYTPVQIPPKFGLPGRF